jgi:8-amino-7-oxononanoate synthase
MFEDELRRLKEQDLYRTIRDRAGAQGRTIVVEGREVLNFASNDYLGLAADSRLADEAVKTVEAFGTGAGASRLLSGGTGLHRRLEERAAAFKGTEAAVLFNSGYAANTGAIPSLVGEGDAILSDELNHASIIDGCRLSRAAVHVYRHRDVAHLRELLGSVTARRVLVITDTVFSMDGDIAPLPELFANCKRSGAMLYLDDAHGTGVLGGGRGALAHFGLVPAEWVVQLMTLGKALGAEGGIVTASAEVVDWLVNSARSLIYATALPPASCAAALEALSIAQDDEELLRRLWGNRAQLVEGLRKLGLQTGPTETPIVPVMMRDASEALSVSARLWEEGIYAPAIRPPTVAVPRLRLTVTAAHATEDIDRLLDALENVYNL